MSKRQKFVISSVSLSAVFFLTASLDSINRVLAISGITLLSIVLFYWSLSENLRRDATLLVLIPSALFTFGVGSFWFLLPSVAIARAPIVILYGLGIYALLLTANIYSVSTVGKIELLRAAKSVGFVITLFTSFLLFNTIFSLRAPVYVSSILVFIVSFLLLLPGLWASVLGSTIKTKVLQPVLSYSYIITFLSIALFFWPTTVVENTIFITALLYVLLGLGQIQLEERLFKAAVREYLLVGSIVFISMILSASWRG